MRGRGAVAPGGSAGVRAAGWQRGAGQPGGAAGRRGGAARERGCRRPGLRGGNGAQHLPSPQPRSAVGLGTPTPQQPPHGDMQGGEPAPRTLQHPRRPAPTLVVPGGFQPHSPPLYRSKCRPRRRDRRCRGAAGPGGRDSRRGRDRDRGRGHGGAAASRWGWPGGAARGGESGMSQGIPGDALGPGHPIGDLGSVTLRGGSRNGFLERAEPRTAGQWGLQRVLGAC